MINKNWSLEAEVSTPTLQINPPQTIVEKVENSIYFYSDVYRETVLKLNRELRQMNNDLYYRSVVTKSIPADIYLYIQSYGGNLFSGMSVMDTILKSNVKINTVIDGCAASAATLLSIAGSKR